MKESSSTARLGRCLSLFLLLGFGHHRTDLDQCPDSCNLPLAGVEQLQG